MGWSKRLLLILIVFCGLTAAVPDKTTTIFVIGDSTAANKDISGGKQERGWAMALQCYFDDNIAFFLHFFCIFFQVAYQV